ncbi:uncharacterized protein RJT20DRAFT_130517 [Scheffersomyces xylosifermentans]|uniref:uncharacterized protein n=1 Tax=Scheffersomyces xylosifermentans TaxID=1304137 RepID=UPI00315D6877
MDPNLVDPSIAGSDIYHHHNHGLDGGNKDGESLHNSQRSEIDDHANVFSLNEYVTDHENDHDDSTATAALMQFNSLVSNEASGGERIVGNGSNEYAMHDETEIYENNSNGNDSSVSSNTNNGNNGNVTNINNKKTNSDSSNGSNTSVVKLVQYDPSEKPKRLGRPRKNITNNLAPPENSSSQNYNEAIISKFRLDSQPLEGPGSRGGRQGGRRSPRGRVTSGTVRKRKQQSMLNFSTDSNKTSVGLTKTEKAEKTEKTEKTEEEEEEIDKSSEDKNSKDTSTVHSEVEVIELEENTSDQDDKEITNDISSKTTSPESTETTTDAKDKTEKVPKLKKLKAKPSKSTTPIKENKKDVKITTNSTKKRSRTSTTSSKRSKHSRLTSISRTTVLTSNNKLSRQLPGPLIGLHYDLYDENIINADQNVLAKTERIALGYEVKKSVYASDIMTIVSYLNKFKEVIDLDPIGPGAIESGLSLNVNNAENGEGEKSEHDSSYISPQMEVLYFRLLSLVLNRKRPVTTPKAIADLKSMSLHLGLPKEWKDATPLNQNIAQEKGGLSPVDPNTEVHLSSVPEALEEKVHYNPFTLPEVENQGLKGLTRPLDRLILLRTLVQWSLTSSDQIRAFITQSTQSQDVPGDKDTYYASLSILKGFKYAEATKKEAEFKLAKRKSEEPVKYVDPTSNPLVHSMSIRLNEELAGDLGFHAGRFYLCRVSNENNGGLASIKKMKSVWSATAGLGVELPSDFKLYVQDVYRMLVDSLSSDGVEFDDKGNEVFSKVEDKSETGGEGYWYEVASNSSELQKFVDYLSIRLGITEADSEAPPVVVIPMTSMIYKPTLNLHDYLAALLPLITQQESIHVDVKRTDKRASRSRPIDYNDRKAVPYIDAMEEEEFIDNDGDVDDDYEEEEREEFHEAYEEDGEEDDDYED